MKVFGSQRNLPSISTAACRKRSATPSSTAGRGASPSNARCARACGPPASATTAPPSKCRANPASGTALVCIWCNTGPGCWARRCRCGRGAMARVARSSAASILRRSNLTPRCPALHHHYHNLLHRGIEIKIMIKIRRNDKRFISQRGVDSGIVFVRITRMNTFARKFTTRSFTLTLAGLFATLAWAACAAPGAPPAKKILVFTKSSGFQHDVIKRTNENLSFAEKILKQMGETNNLDFTFTKDGTLITADNIAKY